MDVTKTEILKFMHQKALFVIPIYQRSYSWETKHCERLFDDIITVGKGGESPTHFFGSIVAVNPPGTITPTLDRLVIIDGQQRLTTITLLLKALSKIVSVDNAKSVTRDIIDDYLFNKSPNPEDKQKLRLTYLDKESLDLLLADSTPSSSPSKHIQANYDYFTKELAKREDELDIIWAGLQRLRIVTIGIELDLGDSPQLIFETLNSTGLRLTKADLIRNFLLMGQQEEKQNQLYTSYWRPMDQIIKQSKSKNAFDDFIKDFLTVKRLVTPESRESIYAEFKEYWRDENYDNTVCLKELHRFAELYKIVALEIHPDRDIKQAVSNLNQLKMTSAYPFLLQVFSDLEKKEITPDVVIEIIETLQSYRFRRQICELTTSGEARLFAELYTMIDKETKHTYAESVKAILQSQKLIKRFPTNDQFYDKLLWADMYSGKIKDIYPLIKLENGLRLKKESLNQLDDPTMSVEHILPQNPNLPDCWRKALGGNAWQDIQNQNKNRLGNLTITNSNSEMSDKCFTEKKETLDKTNYLLSACFKDLTTWNETNIDTRTKELAKHALQVWKHPDLADEIVKKYEDVDEDVDEDEEDILNAETEWESKIKSANPDVIQTLDKLKKELVAKYEPVPALVFTGHIVRLHFYTEEPEKTENLFLVITLKPTVLNVTFRIDPNNLAFVNKKIEYKKKGSAIRKRGGANWFRKTSHIPGHAERRMRVYEEDLPIVLEQIEHAYQTTSQRLNYKNI